MAAAAGRDNPARGDMEELNRFRELFQGRFSSQEAAALLERFGGNANEAANFVMGSETHEIRQIIEEEDASWELVTKCERVRTSQSVLDQVRSGQIQTCCRLFACGQCDNVWWRRTPGRKPVSKCKRCRNRFDAVPRDREWGWALFKCPKCDHEFGGFCGIWVPSPCYQCGQIVMPYCIQPPTGNRPSHTRQKHQCSAPNCPGRNGRTHGGIPMTRPDGLPMTCVHPSTRRMEGKPLVIVPSDDHESSGSTVDTFLPQGDLCRTYETVIPMPTIDE